MTPCEDKASLLGALMDGELDAANTAEMERHLKTCQACAAAAEDLGRMRSALRAPGVAHEPSEPFRRRLAIALAAEERRRAPRPKHRPPRPSMGLGVVGAGGGLAAVGFAALLFTTVVAPVTAFQTELVGDHVRSLMADHLVDVATSDRHTVKPWFAGKAPFSPAVIDLAPQGFPLAGGRLDWARGQRAAALVFRRRLHVINVFVLPSSAVPAGAGPGARNGYNLVRWSAGGLDYWAVSDLDRKELTRFRDLYKAAMAG